MITTICFDLDNTLIDRQEAAKRTFLQLMEQDAGRTLTPAEYEPLIEEFLKVDRLGHYGYADNNQWYIKSCSFAKQRTNQEYFKAWAALSGANARVYPWTKEVLDVLSKRYKLGIITNGDSKTQRAKLDVLHNVELFKSIVVGGESQYPKPHPSIFEKSMKELECKPEEMIFLGDNLEADIIGAKNCGIRAIWINQYQLPNHDNHEEIETIESLLEMEF